MLLITRKSEEKSGHFENASKTVKTYNGIPPLAEINCENCNIFRNYNKIKSVSIFWTTLYSINLCIFNMHAMLVAIIALVAKCKAENYSIIILQ